MYYAHFLVRGDGVIEREYARGVAGIVAKTRHKRYGAVYLCCKVGKVVIRHAVRKLRVAIANSADGSCVDIAKPRDDAETYSGSKSDPVHPDCAAYSVPAHWKWRGNSRPDGVGIAQKGLLSIKCSMLQLFVACYIIENDFTNVKGFTKSSETGLTARLPWGTFPAAPAPGGTGPSCSHSPAAWRPGCICT